MVACQQEKILYEDDFTGGPENWVVETPEKEGSRVEVRDGRLLIDVSDGATVWFREKLSGNIAVEYERKVIMEGGNNDRLSDLNMFWMAKDPENPDDLFTRSGVFAEYHELSQYYAGIGGNENTTTRFRKYQGDGERTLLQEYTDEAHLLKPNHTYRVRITVRDGTTRVFVDGEEYFSYEDPEPLTEGYFGFRTVMSRQEIDHFKIYRLE